MARREVETTEFVAFARRIMRALGRRTAEADEVELRLLIDLQAEVETAIVTAVRGMRARGCSWSYISLALGTTRQNAQQRFGKKVAA